MGLGEQVIRLAGQSSLIGWLRLDIRALIGQLPWFLQTVGNIPLAGSFALELSVDLKAWIFVVSAPIGLLIPDAINVGEGRGSDRRESLTLAQEEKEGSKRNIIGSLEECHFITKCILFEN